MIYAFNHTKMFLNFTFPMTIYDNIFAIFVMIFQILEYYLYNYIRVLFKKRKTDKKIKLGLLTNEIPPVVYGGVATWIVNFIRMFENDERVEVIPIFLAYNDVLPDDCYQKYKGIRVIETPEDIKACFSDIDVCVNNLWIALDTIIQIKDEFPYMNIVSVCHSLIRMENITNLGSCYTSNFNQQEIRFQHSDYVILISKAEEAYYNQFGYNLFGYDGVL